MMEHSYVAVPKRAKTSDTTDNKRTIKNSKSPISIENTRLCWLRGRDLNPRPSGYEPDELPDCSTPRYESHSRPRPQVPDYSTMKFPTCQDIFSRVNHAGVINIKSIGYHIKKALRYSTNSRAIFYPPGGLVIAFEFCYHFSVHRIYFGNFRRIKQ